MSKRYVLSAFTETPWVILPTKLEELAEIVTRHVNGEKLSPDEVQSRIHGSTARPQERRVQKVAVLPLFGTIFPRANMMTEISGGTSAQKFGETFSALLADPSVDAIVLDVDSPGGSSSGIEEVSNLIFKARGQKPIVAVANYLMASAAYWIGSSADELVVSPSADVGSIGAYVVHEDVSAALEQDGVKLSIISEGKYKTAGNSYEPLTEEARAYIQESVHEVYDAFVGAVARNRGVTVETVRNGFGEGGLVGAKKAVEMGMADRVETLNETINRLLGVPTSSGAQASAFENTSQSTENGQVPVSASNPTDEARARLAAVGTKQIEGDSMYLRSLLKEREAKVARAQALVDAADKESRDMTEPERNEFVQLLGDGEIVGEVAALDAKIKQVQDEREKLRAAVERKFVAGNAEAEKPEESKPANTMKRDEFNKLDPTAKAEAAKSGITIVD